MFGCRGQTKPGPQLMRWQAFTVVILALFGAGCHTRERFTHVDAQNPYIMFDQQTAQSCWAGPADSNTAASGEFDPGELTPEEAAELEEGENPRVANPEHLPFCKDLKPTK